VLIHIAITLIYICFLSEIREKSERIREKSETIQGGIRERSGGFVTVVTVKISARGSV